MKEVIENLQEQFLQKIFAREFEDLNISSGDISYTFTFKIEGYQFCLGALKGLARVYQHNNDNFMQLEVDTKPMQAFLEVLGEEFDNNHTTNRIEDLKKELKILEDEQSHNNF